MSNNVSRQEIIRPKSWGEWSWVQKRREHGVDIKSNICCGYVPVKRWRSTDNFDDMGGNGLDC